MDQKIEMTVIALSKSASANNNFVIVLEDEVNNKKLPILIGANEAQYIGIVMENLNTKRPLTHDLIFSIVSATSAFVREIFIHDIQNEIFLAKIILITQGGEKVEIDARPSDAIAIALKAGCPIYANQKVLNDSGIEHQIYVTESSKTSYQNYSLEELEELLKKVLAKEDYESAIRIRETIHRKTNPN